MSTHQNPILKKVIAQRALARRSLLYFTQFTHPAYSAGWVHADIARRLMRFSKNVAERKSPRLIMLMPPRHGKLLADDTMVWTRAGWSTHGNLKVGDEVVGLDGKFTKVIGVSEPGLATHELITNSGARFECHLDHEWTVLEYCSKNGPKSSKRYVPRTIETREMWEYAQKRGHLMSASALSMRKFYLPQVQIENLDTQTLEVFKYRRPTRNAAGLAIEEINPLPRPVPGRCIQVAAIDGVYLVGRDFIPTHNSELASIRFPAWHLGHNPSHEMINVGYNLDLPMIFSRKVREIIRSNTYRHTFPDARLNPESQSVESWNLTEGGGNVAAGVGGGITGKGANCVLPYCTVHTPYGTVLISEVKPGDEVYGYDHRTQKVRLTTVRAVQKRRLRPEDRIFCEAGGFACTADHRIYTTTSGYRRADALVEKSVPGLRLAESGARTDVQKLLFKEATSDLHPMRQAVRTPSRGTREIPGAESSTRVFDSVVDIQTATDNFFCEGILVHNCLIIDDPIKNQEEADSVGIRDRLWEWFMTTAYTRLSPGGGILLIETFWSYDDLAGRLMEAMRTNPQADRYEIIKYPALAEGYEYRDRDSDNIVRSDDPLEPVPERYEYLRPKGFCLHEARYSTMALERIRANVSPRVWSALYQQNPVPDEGMYFRKDFFVHWDQLPPPFGFRIYTAWDFAIGEREQNDWTVGATVLQDSSDFLYVLDITRFRADSFGIVERMLDTAQIWMVLPDTGYTMGCEDGQIWRAIQPLFKKRSLERRVYPSITPLTPLTDKVARARPLQGRMQQGRFVFPGEAHWLAQAKQEMLRFPAGQFDDVVDALAWATRLAMLMPPPYAKQPPKLKSWKDTIHTLRTGGRSHMVA